MTDFRNSWDAPQPTAAHKAKAAMRQCIERGAALESQRPPRVRQFRDPARRKVEFAACLAECAGVLPNQCDDER